MTTPPRRRWRLLKRGAWYALAAVLVLLAVGSGIASQLLPLAERHPQKIADWLSARAQRKVAFDHVETEWTRRGPLLRLDNLRVGDAANPLRVGDAEILIAQYAGLLPGRSFTELRVRGLDLTLQRDAAGRWSVRGLPGQQQQEGDPFATLERLGELQVSHARLHVLAPELGIDTRLPRIDLRMRVDGARIRGGANAWLREGSMPFTIALDFDRVAGDGRAYVGTRKADLRELTGTLALAGITPMSGRGRVQTWGELDDGRVVAVHTDAALRDVTLRGTPLQAGQAAPTQTLAQLVLDARWRGSLRQWRADAARLRIGEGDDEQVLDGLAVVGGRNYGLRAQRIDAAPLLSLLALTDMPAAGLRRWLHDSAAGAVLEDVDLHGTRGGSMHASARVRGLHFAPVGTAPGMRGIDADLLGDADGLRLRFDPRAKVAFDWPAGFGVVHEFGFDGEAVLWRDGAGWTVRTPGLAIAGKDLRVNARGGIGFPNDGGRPHLDIAADIGDAQVAAAHGFWIHHLMPKSTVDWLDAALQGGHLRDIHAVVAGDLDDWPFRSEPGQAGAGRFRIDARMQAGKLKFQPDWPAMEQIDGDIRFEADGFTIAGKGRLAGVPVTAFKAGIPRFGRAELSVDATAAGDAKEFLAMLRQSPLHKQHGEVMDNLQVAGAAKADFHMLLPFHHDGAPKMRMQGMVDLAGATMREQRWKLAFTEVRGEAQYDHDGFLAENLRVIHDGAPGQLSLRAGAPHVRDAKHAFEAELQANIGIDDLLDKAGTLEWLKPHMDGRSPWTVAVAIPQGAAQSAPSQAVERRMGRQRRMPDFGAGLDPAGSAGAAFFARSSSAARSSRAFVSVFAGSLRASSMLFGDEKRTSAPSTTATRLRATASPVIGQVALPTSTSFGSLASAR